MLLGLDGLFSTTATSPIDQDNGHDFQCWLEQVRSELGVADAEGVVFWHPKFEKTVAEKRRRVTIHLFDNALKPIGFAKVSFDDGNDRRLEAEARALHKLEAQGVKRFRYPKVLSLSKAGEHVYLIVEPLPETALPVALCPEAFPEQAVAEYAGPARHVPGDEVRHLSWWQKYEEAVDTSCTDFVEELSSRIQDGVEVCRAHGDMQPSNVNSDGGDVWIFDGEDCCHDAPCMSDAVDFYMMPNFRKTLANPIVQLRRFADRFLSDANTRVRLAVMLALAFRSTVCPEDAKLFMQHWNQIG